MNDEINVGCGLDARPAEPHDSGLSLLWLNWTSRDGFHNCSGPGAAPPLFGCVAVRHPGLSGTG